VAQSEVLLLKFMYAYLSPVMYTRSQKGVYLHL